MKGTKRNSQDFLQHLCLEVPGFTLIVLFQSVLHLGSFGDIAKQGLCHQWVILSPFGFYLLNIKDFLVEKIKGQIEKKHLIEKTEFILKHNSILLVFCIKAFRGFYIHLPSNLNSYFFCKRFCTSLGFYYNSHCIWYC